MFAQIDVSQADLLAGPKSGLGATSLLQCANQEGIFAMAVDLSKTFDRSQEGYQALTWVLYVASAAIAVATLGEISGTLLFVGCIVVILLARSRKDDAAATIHGSHLANIASVMTIALVVAVVLLAITILTLGIGIIITWPAYVLFLIWLGYRLVKGVMRLNDGQAC